MASTVLWFDIPVSDRARAIRFYEALTGQTPTRLRPAGRGDRADHFMTPPKPRGFAKTLYVGWGDLDANGHMRNTAYLDKAADVRMYYFAEHGFPSREFARLAIGPVVRKDELEYFRELRLLDPVTVTLQVEALSTDGARFVLRNEFWRADTLVARVTTTGGWLDLKARKLTTPPETLRAVMEAAPRTERFRTVEGLKRTAPAG